MTRPKPKPRRRGGPRQPAPPLDATVESVEAYTRWIASETTAGRMLPVETREQNKSAALMLQTVRTKAGLHELDDLRRMLTAAQTMATERKRREVASRYAGDDTAVTEFSVEDE